MTTLDLPLAGVHVNGHVRQDLGDVAGLAASLSAVGLLHPIVVTPGHELVCGARRLAAARQLGWPMIRATVADSLSDVALAAQAEADENTCREPLTPHEALALQQKLIRLYQPAVQETHRQASRTGGTKGGRSRPVNRGGTSCTTPIDESPKRDNAARTKHKAAADTGLSAATLAKVEAIEAAAKADPAKYGELAEELKQPKCKVNAVYKRYQKLQLDITPELEEQLRIKELPDETMTKALLVTSSALSEFDRRWPDPDRARRMSRWGKPRVIVQVREMIRRLQLYLEEFTRE